MRNRIPNPSTAEREAFGLVAWLEKTRLVLPLKGVECSFSVCGDVVSVEIDQVFHQNNAQPLDCLYTFPLPASAAVYRCEMHVNGRRVVAKVEERERARELAREKRAAGHRTALVEMERDNLFTLSLGNVQPGDVVVIRFAYFQTLTRLADWTSFSIPFCPGVRYIPGTPLLRAPKGRGAADDTDQVPDASRISPPRIDRLHPDAAYLVVEGVIEHPLDDVKDISSPSHPVLVRDGSGRSQVSIANQDAVPDWDFTVRWTETGSEAVQPSAWVTRGRQESFALIRLRAPDNVTTSEDYEQDVYFLIDRSGSMEGLKYQKAVEAFREFLKALGRNDRVWATFFESRVHDLAEKPLPPAQLLADPAVNNLEALGTTGGTELLPALEHVLGKIARHSKGRPVSLVILTDGQVGNEAEILQRLSRHPQLRVNVFGIDVAINDGFLNKLAAQHHGTSCLLSPRDDVVGAVARLGQQLRRPVLTSVRVLDGWEPAGQELPDLHAGEILLLPLKGNASAKTAVLEGKLPDGTIKTYRFELVETDSAAVRLLWAKRRIDFLLAHGDTAAAIALAKKSNLVCEGAAFVAWDEAEKVAVSGPEREVYQPSMTLGVLRRMDLTFEDAKFCCLDADLKRPPPLAEHFLRAKLMPGEQTAETAPDLAGLRGEMEQFEMFQTPGGKKLLDCLFDWAWSRSRDLARRAEQLKILLAGLQRASDQSPLERVKIVCRWIERNLKGEFKDRALKALQPLEASARLAKAPAANPAQGSV